MSATAACPKCDPLCPELDEDGRPYACYFCGDTGSVPQAQADAYWLDLQDAAEYRGMQPVVEGKHLRVRRYFDGWGDCIDSDVVMVDLLPAEVMRAAYRQKHREFFESCTDDIPF